MKRYVRLSPLTISILTVITGIFSYIFAVPFLDIMELKTIDLRFQSRGPTSPLDKVVLAVIDERSITREGKWVWPRSKIADLITRLSDAGAAVIALDIAFVEPDENDQKMINIIDGVEHEAHRNGFLDADFENYLNSLRKNAKNDEYLTEAITNSQAKIVLGYFFLTDEEEAKHLRDSEIQRHKQNIASSRYTFVRYTSKDAQNVALYEAAAPQSNLDMLSEAADSCGFFNKITDVDGVVRRMYGVLKFGGQLYAPLSLMALSQYLKTPISLSVDEVGIQTVNIGNITLPVDEYGRVIINYRGSEKTFDHISVTDILNGNIKPGLFEDKIVIVGPTATGIYDLLTCPFGTEYPGLETHANIIDSILARDFLYQPYWLAAFDILAIMVAGLFLGAVLPRSGVMSGALAGFTVFIGYIVLCQLLFTRYGLILNLVYPLTVTVIVYVSITAYRYLVETRQKKFIRDAFSTYLAPSVVENLIQSPEKLLLGGEERRITAFFSDIQGFTSIAEKLTPPELVILLNEFLTEMTDIILRNEGTVDKFEGDAIIAFFGAPNEIANQAEVACKACIEMQNRLAELRTKWKQEGRPELMMRIGLCTGPAVVGNMGSKNRMDYTMMGDTVNTGARLEGANKMYGTEVLVSESTFLEKGDRIIGREIDYIHVIGKKAPLRIFEILGFKDELDEKVLEMVKRYEKALELYKTMSWQAAVERLDEILTAFPEDGPSKIMRSRCINFDKNPPEEGWDGSIFLTTK